jgi:hypothetical protein
MFIIPSHLCRSEMPGGLGDQFISLVAQLRIVLELIMRHSYTLVSRRLEWRGHTVDERLATHPDEKVGITKPLNGILNTRNRPQGDLGIQRIDHTGDEPVHQS